MFGCADEAAESPQPVSMLVFVYPLMLSSTRSFSAFCLSAGVKFVSHFELWAPLRAFMGVFCVLYVELSRHPPPYWLTYVTT